MNLEDISPDKNKLEKMNKNNRNARKFISQNEINY